MAIHTALPSRNPNHASTKLLYAGVGSRLTPMPILGLMRKLGFRLAELGYTLRSGAADGADAAFEAGCDEAGGSKAPMATPNCSTYGRSNCSRQDGRMVTIRAWR